MIVIFITSLLAVLLAYLSSRIPRKNHLFEAGFIIITIVAAIRWDYACDYVRYYDLFMKDYHIYGFWSALSLGYFKEPGWAILNHIFPSSTLGFVLLVALISIFQNYVYYRFISDNVPPARRWFAMCIYLFSTSYWLLNMSMLRQGLTITMFVLASRYIAEKKLLPSLLIILAAVSIHRSAYIILPFLLFSFAPLKNSKLTSIVLLIVFFIVLLARNTANDIFEFVFTFDALQGYDHYMEDFGSASFGYGAIINIIPFFVIFYFFNAGLGAYNKNFRLIGLFTLIGGVLLPLQIYYGAFSRINAYFTVFSIVVVPVVYGQIQQNAIKAVLTTFFMIMLFYQYYEFLFVTDWSSVSWRNYHTFFELL